MLIKNGWRFHEKGRVKCNRYIVYAEIKAFSIEYISINEIALALQLLRSQYCNPRCNTHNEQHTSNVIAPIIIIIYTYYVHIHIYITHIKCYRIVSGVLSQFGYANRCC